MRGCRPALSRLRRAEAAFLVLSCGAVQFPFSPAPTLLLAKFPHFAQYAIGPMTTTAWPRSPILCASLAVPAVLACCSSSCDTAAPPFSCGNVSVSGIHSGVLSQGTRLHLSRGVGLAPSSSSAAWTPSPSTSASSPLPVVLSFAASSPSTPATLLDKQACQPPQGFVLFSRVRHLVQTVFYHHPRRGGSSNQPSSCFHHFYRGPGKTAPSIVYIPCYLLSSSSRCTPFAV